MDALNVNGNPAMAGEFCKDCIFFRRLPIDPKNIGVKPQGGICKRMPPSPVIIYSADARGQAVTQLQSFFPPVPDLESCAEWDDGVEVEEADAS